MSENEKLAPKLAEALNGMWDSLTDEQKEKAKACKTWDELTALAGKEGIELPDELLDAVAGGYIYRNVVRDDLRTFTEWQVVNDNNGSVMKRSGDRSAAENYAKAKKQSTDVISWEDLNYLRKNPKKQC